MCVTTCMPPAGAMAASTANNIMELAASVLLQLIGHLIFFNFLATWTALKTVLLLLRLLFHHAMPIIILSFCVCIISRSCSVTLHHVSQYCETIVSVKWLCSMPPYGVTTLSVVRFLCFCWMCCFRSDITRNLASGHRFQKCVAMCTKS